MKYNYKKYIEEAVLSNRLYVSEEDVKLLRNYIDEINKFRFPELNGLSMSSNGSEWWVKNRTFHFIDCNSRIVSVRIVDNGYIIGDSNYSTGEIYLKRVNEKDNDSLDEKNDKKVTEMVFYYGNDLVCLKGYYSSPKDCKYEMFVYADVIQHNFDLSSVFEDLEPDFVFELEVTSKDCEKNTCPELYWKGKVGTDLNVFAGYVPTSDIVSLRLQAIECARLCRKYYLGKFDEHEKVYIKS